jgi:small-conductance mechanosensitive channel
MVIKALIFVGLSVVCIASLLYQRKIERNYQDPERHTLLQTRKHVWFSAGLFLLISGVWVTLYTMPQFWHRIFTDKVAYKIILDITSGLLFLVLYGLIITIINAVIASLASYKTNQYLGILPLLSYSLKVAAFLGVFNEALSFFGLLDKWTKYVQQFNQVIIIGTIGWVLYQGIQIGENIFVEHNRKRLKDTIKSRRAYTHIAIIRHILVILVTVMTIAAMLMTFDRIRAAGTAILASAGVLATIVGLSARGLLENIFKGMQLAITQPIRLKDVVTIHGETGTITDITLHHVVLSLGDRSQVIVPTGDFLEKTFKNWTHCSEDLLGNVCFYVNFNMPIEPIREKFYDILKTSECWDQGVGHVEVSDFKNRLVELKLVMSAKSGRHLAALRNEVREKLLQYMQTAHPTGLPG